ncbi:response regulator [Catenovulum maritimum]|uniref:Chemotaxis protein CheY n=1 Tax=Catenovulum maritimum TaxID=1513271 RepID=A0A0J8GZS4_9ALTE|nr:response regulator [Catenovulum maritimum]KMT66248.1 chemotaxis protein CheY [Catenovulum maritimum]
MQHLSPADLSILLVEPSAMQRKVITKHLLKEDISNIEEANDIASARASILNHVPDLVISSLHFPDGTGLELLHHIRHSEPYSDVPFMLISSEYRKEQLEEFKQAGVVAILPKPFNSEHLGTAINSTLDLLTTDELELELFDIHDIRVLVVDDSRLARNHIKRVLTNLGVQRMTEAVNGAEAKRILEDEMFDLIVTDYNMPELDGKQLTEFVRNQSQQSHIPILMVSSEANESHLANIEQAGVNAICDKPFEPHTVKELLFHILNHEH